MLRALSASCILIAAAACGKAEPASRPAAPPAITHSAAGPAAKASAAPLIAPPIADDSFRAPAAERIIAIGDIHGDVKAARNALRLGGAIDDAGKWVGGTLVVVQTGDQLDRGDDEPQILDLFARLKNEAKAAGGALYALDGNHEVMNVQGDFRYVTEDGFHDFSDRHASEPVAHLLEALPIEQRGRASAFLPGGDVARRLATQPIVLQVGDNVFVHGGVLEAHVRFGLGRINQEAREWMNGPPSAPAPRSLLAQDAPIWTRAYSDGTPTSAACDELGRVLGALSARRLVVGHTVQKEGISSACEERVWRIDVGLSHFYGGKPSVLEIRGDRVRALTAEPSPR